MAIKRALTLDWQQKYRPISKQVKNIVLQMYSPAFLARAYRRNTHFSSLPYRNWGRLANRIVYDTKKMYTYQQAIFVAQVAATEIAKEWITNNAR